MSAVETRPISATETGQMSAVETRQMLKSQIRGRAQNHRNGPKWVQNGRQASRIGPNESHGRSGAFGTGPAIQDPEKIAKFRLFGFSRWVICIWRTPWPCGRHPKGCVGPAKTQHHASKTNQGPTRPGHQLGQAATQPAWTSSYRQVCGRRSHGPTSRHMEHPTQ